MSTTAFKWQGLQCPQLRPPATPGQQGQPPVYLCRVEPLGVERGSPPLHHLIVFRVERVPQRLQIFHVAGGTSDILRRAGPLPRQAGNLRHVRASNDSFDDHVVLPVVTEIVLVTENIPLDAEEFSQPSPPFVPPNQQAALSCFKTRLETVFKELILGSPGFFLSIGFQF
jgi:hypothetical protein